MNKKALTQETLTKGIIAMVVLVVIIGIFFWPGNLLAKSTGINVTKYVHFGYEQIPAAATTLPEDLQTVYDNLVSALSQKGEFCLAKIPAPSANFNGYRFQFQKAPDGTRIIAEKNEQGKFIEVKSTKISTTLCSVAGTINVQIQGRTTAVNVAQEFLAFKDCLSLAGQTASTCLSARSPYNHNDDITPIYLKSNTDLSNAQISYKLSSVSYNGQEILLMYKPTSNNVCFLPTHSGLFTRIGCDASGDTLDDDCLTDLLPSGNLNPIQSDGKQAIPFCSSEPAVSCANYKKCSDITDMNLCNQNICGLKCQVHVPGESFCEDYNPNYSVTG